VNISVVQYERCVSYAKHFMGQYERSVIVAPKQKVGGVPHRIAWLQSLRAPFLLDNRHYMPSLKLIRPQQSGSQLLQHIRSHRSVPDEKRITCKIGKLNRKSFS
jgi:hypothetical protein